MTDFSSSLVLVAAQSAPPAATYSATSAGIAQRATPYAENIPSPFAGERQLAADGHLFVATNPTPGTEITSHIMATWAATTPSFLIKNANSNQRVITLLDLTLAYVVPPASGTNAFALVTVDTGTRYSSGGSTITPVNASIANGTSTGAQVYAGAVTATAATASVRQIGRACFSSVIMVLQDVVTFNFGGPDGGLGSLGGTVARKITMGLPAVSLAPGEQALIYLWYESNSATAATWEFALKYAER